MTTDTKSQQSFETVEIQKTIDIAAPIEIAFEAMLDELGPDAQMMDGTAMPFKLEAWPGGRWYRDLGNNAGHLWGHVQVIKPPTLLEICGPMMMSYPGGESSSISLYRSGKRNAPGVRASRHGIDLAPASRGHAQGMGALDRQDSPAPREQDDAAQEIATDDSISITSNCGRYSV